jgi:D-xylose transport system permease protein
MDTTTLKRLFTQYKILALLVAVALIWTFFHWMTEGGFTSARNVSNLMRQMSITGILACGMVFVIIAGEIDLSIGSLLGLLGGMAAVLDVTHGMPLPLSIAVFVVAWIGQFIGHKIEGKKPSFFDDMRFLLVGTLFVLGFLYRRFNLAY